MENSNIEFDKHQANHRGFLLGITLAELMLITVFVLLLLLGNYHRVEESFGGSNQLTDATAFGKVIVAAKSNRPLSETWRVLSRKAEALASTPKQFDNWLDQLEQEPLSEIVRGTEDTEALQTEVRELSSELAASETRLSHEQDRINSLEKTLAAERDALAVTENQSELLKLELANTKEGGMVLCMFEKPLSGASTLRGRSIPLGSVYLEADGITLIQRNESLVDMQVLDYVGDMYDMEDALNLLNNWPTNRKLNFDEFVTIGRQFVSIGDRESEKRQQCRFSLNYYIEDFSTPLAVFTDVFQKYFYQQSRISKTEFESIILVN